MNRNINIITLIIFILILIHPYPIQAQTPTKKSSSPSATPAISLTPSNIIQKLKQIEILKEKIATKVAELREKDKGSFGGTIKKIDASSIRVSSRKGERQISFSDDTIFYNLSEGEKTEINLKKIKEGDHISAFGYLSEDKNILSAKYIYSISVPIHLIGKVVNIDRDNYTLTLKDKQGSTIIDIETSTSSYLYNKEKMTISKIGFSKFKIGDSIHLFGIPNIKEENRVTAKKIYVFSFAGQTTVNPTQTAISPTIELTIKPTVTKKISTPSATITKKK